MTRSPERMSGFLRSRRAAVGLGILAVVLVFAVAVGADRSISRTASRRALIGVHSVLGDLMVVLAALILVELCVVVYVLVRDMHARGRIDPRTLESRAAWWTYPLSALLLAAMVGGIGFAILHARAHPRPLPAATPPTGTPPVPLGGGSEVPTQPVVVHWWILAALAVLGLAAAAWVFYLRRRAPAGDEEQVEDERHELRAAVEASLGDLDDDADSRQAVIRAYARLEHFLAARGVARKPWETHSEYLARWLHAVEVDASVAGRLVALYERARFSLNVVDDSMRQDAKQALLQLRSELEGGTV